MDLCSFTTGSHIHIPSGNELHTLLSDFFYGNLGFSVDYVGYTYIYIYINIASTCFENCWEFQWPMAAAFVTFPSEIGRGEVHLIGGRHRPQRRGVSAPVAQKAGGDWPVLRSGHWAWDDHWVDKVDWTLIPLGYGLLHICINTKSI